MNSAASKDNRYQRVVLGAAVLLMGMVGALDWLTDPRISLGTFYLIPVMLSAWVGTRWQRIGICVFAGVVWCGTELWWAGEDQGVWVEGWNSALRLGVFLIVSELTAMVASRHTALAGEVLQRKRVEFELKRLNETLEARVAERTAAAEKRSLQLLQSEAALRRQAEVLQSILNSMGDGVVVADKEGKILLLNPQAERLLQMEDGPLSLQAWLDRHRTYLPEAFADERGSEHPLLRALRGETVEGAEMLIPRHGGSGNVWVRTSAAPFVDEQGEQRGGVILFSDVTARKRLEKQVAEISDREQRRIGYDLHDGVCQHLVSTAMACDMLAESLAEKGVPEAAQAAQIGDSIGQAIIQARNLARALYPIDLTGDGLHSALEELAGNVEETTKIHCRFRGSNSAKISNQSVGMSLYRIAQEAVNNAVKHSCATHIKVDLDVQQGSILLAVEDDGAGFQQPQLRKGMGLDIMNYRARSIGAALEIQHGSSKGTRIICHLPAASRQAPVHAA